MKGWSRRRSEWPEDLIMEILLQLPVKSLTRFNCICRSWCCCFQSSNFISKHHHINLKNNRLNLLCNRGMGKAGNVIPYFTQLSTEQDDFLSAKHDIQLTYFKDCGYTPDVLGPRNGLLCFYTYPGDGKKSALWNPSTREFKTLPPSSIQPPSPGYIRIHDAGFGFDSNTGDYKVIQFVSLVTVEYLTADDHTIPSGVDFTVLLYSLKTDSWKEIPFTGVFPSGQNLCDSYVNGICFWQARRVSPPDPEYNDRVLSFDPAGNKFSTFSLPEFGGSVVDYMFQLLEFNGSLGVIIYPLQGTEKSFDLWVMNGAYTWTKHLCIESIPGVENPLGFWKNGDLFLETPDHQLVLFEHRTGEVKRLGVNTFVGSMRVVAYAESLVPINGTSEHKEYIIRHPCIK
ncbi:hypothetical protein V6N13_014159 [Hibiscus sabdariffa]|uniref:F-box domain-containing protein n=1 Tax=Hibiscus sabdariffa TaxID=183260 RepID=A0ABR2RUD3_9ROSI